MSLSRYRNIMLLRKETKKHNSEWILCLDECEKLTEESRTINEAISRLEMSGGDVSELNKRAEENKQLRAQKDAETLEARTNYFTKSDTYDKLMNDPIATIKSEGLSWGKKRTESNLMNYAELIELLDIADKKKGADMAQGQAGCYVIKGDGLCLNQALVKFGLSFLEEQGFTSMHTCSFPKTDFMKKCAQLAQFVEVSSKVTDDPPSRYHLDDWMHSSRLPIRFAGNLSCFHKEALPHSNFERVEQFCISTPYPNNSWTNQVLMFINSMEFYQALNLPYQFGSVVSGAVIDPAPKNYKLRAWFPASKTCRDLVSCSNNIDFQARKIEIPDWQKKNEKSEHRYGHLLNCTLMDTETIMWCILENYQKEDGVVIPEVLREFMGGKSFLPFRTED